MGKPIIQQPGIIKVAIVWFFIGILNIYVAYQGISNDVGSWSLISDPLTNEWFRIVIPIGLGLSVAILIAALIQLISIPGLAKGKSWSIKLALGAPIAIAIFNFVIGALYASAPSEYFELARSRIIWASLIGVFQIFAVFIFWKYLNRPEGKFFRKMMNQKSA